MDPRRNMNLDDPGTLTYLLWWSPWLWNLWDISVSLLCCVVDGGSGWTCDPTCDGPPASEAVI